MSPEVRANWTKQVLRRVSSLPQPGRDVLLRHIGADTARAIREAGILAWLPAELHGRVLDATHSVLTSRGATTFRSDLMLANLDQVVLRPLVEGGLSLFGRTPHSIVRMSPRAWTLVTRRCGRQEVTRGSGRCEVRIDFFVTDRRRPPCAT